MKYIYAIALLNCDEDNLEKLQMNEFFQHCTNSCTDFLNNKYEINLVFKFINLYNYRIPRIYRDYRYNYC